MDELLLKYAEKFEDNFPLYCVRGLSDEEIIKALEKCIATNRPYKLNINPKFDY